MVVFRSTDTRSKTTVRSVVVLGLLKSSGLRVNVHRRAVQCSVVEDEAGDGKHLGVVEQIGSCRGGRPVTSKLLIEIL